MSISDAALTEADLGRLAEEHDESVELYPSPCGGTIHTYCPMQMVAHEQHRKTWWTMIRMLEEMGKTHALIGVIDGKWIGVPQYFADLARAAGIEPWSDGA